MKTPDAMASGVFLFVGADAERGRKARTLDGPRLDAAPRLRT
jgi:hypothetical protein